MAATQQAAVEIAELRGLAERGWRLFPCTPRSKVPQLKSWQIVATSDLTTIRQWAARYSGCNWAVLTGSDSSVFVLDVDGDKGRDSLARLETEHGQLPATLVSFTGRDAGGEHRWFNCPAGVDLRGSVGRLGKGLDVRAADGYVIVPPSVHETGRAYQWAEPQRPVVDAPSWLIEMMTVKRQRLRDTPFEQFGMLTQGRRNDGLTRYGGALRRKGAEVPELEARLMEANARRCQPPLGKDEIRKIATSVARYPVGGPDPLQLAWQATQAKSYPTRKAQFLGLCRHLQSARPGLSIALPIERIGELMEVHWTSVSKYRKEAVKMGVLIPAEQYIAHRLAGQYRLIENANQAEPKTLTKPVPLTSGLVRTLPSEHCPSENLGNAPSEISAERGYLELLL